MFAIEANLVSLARISERPFMLPSPTVEEIQGPPFVMLLDHLASLTRFAKIKRVAGAPSTIQYRMLKKRSFIETY
jgi:hypothetical protein